MPEHSDTAAPSAQEPSQATPPGNGASGHPASPPAWMSGLQPAEPGPGFDPSVAHPARVYAYWLGGKDHYAADRQAAEDVIRRRPQVVALLTSTGQGMCDYIDADLRDTATITAAAAATLDFTQPAAVLLLAVLHFIPDTDDPAGIVASLASVLAPGSFVVISHLTADLAPTQVGAGVAAYNTRVPAGLVPRTHSQVSALFGGLPLVPPGVVPVTEWRPPIAGHSRQPADMYGGLARIPGPRM